MTNLRIKHLLIILGCSLITACADKVPQIDLDSTKYGPVIDQGAETPGTLIRKQAQQTYDLEYTTAKNYRAIAQSTTGAWGWAQKQPTLEAAVDQALAECRKQNHNRESEKPCLLVNVNGWWTADIPLNQGES